VAKKQVEELERLLKGFIYSVCAYNLEHCNGCGVMKEQIVEYGHTSSCPVGETEKYFKDKEDGDE